MPGFNALKKLIKQINHHKIEDEEARVLVLARLLGYPILPRGLCNGYAHMMNQAVLVGEEDICLKRIKRINETPPEILIADINQAKEKSAKRIEELTERELIDLEIPAAFDFMMQYQIRFSFKRFSRLRDLILLIKNPAGYRHSIESLTSSKMMDELMGAHRHVMNDDYPEIYSGMTVGAYTRDEMNQYFDSLLKAIDMHNEPLALHLASNTHAISITYNPMKKSWIVADISKCHDTYTAKPQERETLAEALSSSVFSSFVDDDGKYLILKTSFATTPKGRESLHACLHQWMQDPIYNKLHAITPEKSHRVDTKAATNLLRYVTGFSKIYWDRDYTPYITALNNIRNQEMRRALSIFAIAGIVCIALAIVGFSFLTFPVSIPVIITLAFAATAFWVAAGAAIYQERKNEELNKQPEKANTENFNLQQAEVWRVLAANARVAPPANASPQTMISPTIHQTTPSTELHHLERRLTP